MKQITPPVQGEMSFIEHLEALRWHLVRSVVAIVVISIILLFNKSFVFDTLIFGPKKESFILYQCLCWLSETLHLGKVLCISPKNFEIINTDLTGQFIAHLKVSIVLGFVIAFPYIFYEVWKFIQPALYDKERNYTRGIVLTTSLLFIIGAAFGYVILTPFSINFFAMYNVSAEVANRIALSSYVSIITTLVLAAGIMFELPMVVYFLAKLGLVTPAMMRDYRRHAFIIILFIAAVITPADIWTQILVTIPVYGLYELSIWVAVSVSKNEVALEKVG